MKRLIFFGLLFIVFFTNSRAHFSHDEATFDFVKYCKYFQYPVQVHTINTEDGYILKFFRIQAKFQTKFNSNLPVIWLQHGILDSSDTWIVNSEPEENAPAFYFANKGYDVWLGNSRGNKHSRGHVSLDPDTGSDFWIYSWQDMAQYDLPAGFEYIAGITGQKITYIGHSQGTTEMWAALSEKNPVVKKHLKHFISLAPVAYIGNCESTLLNILARNEVILAIKFFNIYEILPESWITKSIGVPVCRFLNIICKGGIEVIADTDANIDAFERMDVVLGHFPSGASRRDLNHYNQLLITGRFGKFDYGTPELNQKYYNQTTPPDYDLSNVDVPVSLFVGTSDKLGDAIDARRLNQELVNTPYKFYKEYPKGHATFVWGKDMSYLLEVEEEIRKVEKRFYEEKILSN